MKKTIILAVVMIISSQLNMAFSQVKGGFKMGCDFSNISWYNNTWEIDKNDLLETKRLITPRLGFILQVGIVDNLFIQTGVFGTSKGFRYDGVRNINEKDYDSKEYQIMLTLDIPVNVGYKLDLDAVKIFGMLGPNLSYGMYATELYKADGEYDNVHQTVGNEITDTFKPINFGLNIEAGVEVDRFQFSGFYTLGFSQLSPTNMDDIKANVFGITAAILFGKVDGGKKGYYR